MIEQNASVAVVEGINYDKDRNLAKILVLSRNKDGGFSES
jgi:hypothetical protein